MTGRVEQWLKEHIGLDATTIGRGALGVALRTRMAACNVSPLEQYEAILLSNPAEGRELIEAVVVPETWFFRDKETFGYLAEWATLKWIPRHPQGVMRLLSMPCSTGEEPISMAITLLRKGFHRFQVEGIDISQRALEVAKRGSYGRNSFRGIPMNDREAYFLSPTPGSGQRGWQIRDEVKRHIFYRQENLLGQGWKHARGQYHVIFCRNLLIYLDERSQQLLLERIEEALDRDGVLFVGSSESYLVSKFGFEREEAPHAFAFRKKEARRIALRSEERLRPWQRLTPPPPKELFQKTVRLGEDGDADGLEECEHLANAGALSEAARKLEAHLAVHPDSVRALFLMGVVSDARGKPAEAERFYRKVLFLDPNHHEALIHLRYLARRRGDLRGEKLLGERLGRIALEGSREP